MEEVRLWKIVDGNPGGPAVHRVDGVDATATIRGKHVLQWAILIASAMFLALFIYRLTKRPVLASVGTALIVTAVFQIIARVQLGYFDEFWPIATVVQFGASFAVALVTAILWKSREPADGHL